MARPPGAFQIIVLTALQQAEAPMSRTQLMNILEVSTVQKLVGALEGLYIKRLVAEDYQDGFTKYRITDDGIKFLLTL